MTNPCPGKSITTPYGKRGSWWSCDRDQYGNGIHTGVDYAAPSGTDVVAARGGTVVYSNHGSAFGYHQIDITCGDGTRDFYAHMRSRAVANGAKVKTGQKIGEVGAEGNVSGAHLHFERHATTSGGWSCSVVRDPAPSINYQESSGSGGSGSGSGEDTDMPDYARAKTTKPLKMKAGQWYAVTWGNVTAGDKFFTDDGIGIVVGGRHFSATLVADVTDRKGGTVRTSYVELQSGDVKETMEQEAHGNVDHVVDTRVGYVSKDRRMRARVLCDNDATLDHATIELLIW